MPKKVAQDEPIKKKGKQVAEEEEDNDEEDEEEELSKSYKKDNFKVSVEGNILTISCDLTKELEESGSGKSIIVSRSPERFFAVPGHKKEISLTFGVYKKIPRGKKRRSDEDDD